jgi:diguanylate cyclase (GGDEF)-like protein
MTLRTRLLLLVLLATLPALYVMIDAAIDYHRHLRADAENTVQKLARLAVKYHESLIDETDYLLNLMVEIPQIREPESGACDTLLKELMFGKPHYANLGVIRPNGEVACSAVHSDQPINLADRSYFKAAMHTQRLSVGNYQIGRFVKKPVQVIALPLLDDERNVRAVVYAALNLDWLMRFTPLSEMPPGSVVTVLDRHGAILSREPDPQGIWTGASLEKAVPFAMRFIASGQEQGVEEGRGVDGVERIYAMARIGSGNERYGYIMIGTPSSELNDALDAALLTHAAIFGFGFLAIMLLAWFGSETMVLKRARILTQATRRMGGGDLGARAMVGGRDEIAQLAAEFNQMGDRLQKDRHQIQRLNRIHGVLSGINGAILRIREREALVREACRIAVERGGLRFAWIGLIDGTTGKLVKAASHGEGKGFLDNHCLADHTHLNSDRCPCVAAIPKGRAVIHNDLVGEAADWPWHEQALAYGFRSIAGFPLRRDGDVIGVLGLYSSEANFFEDPEANLFLELAADISLGLEYIDKDQRIAHLLYHDALTGLPNRRLGEDRLQQMMAHAHHHDRHVGVIVLNVTDFHRVVGVYGHHVADEILNRIAQHLLEQVREGDTVVRLEGDEFAIIFADVASMQEVIHLAQTLVSGLPSLLQSGEREIHLTMRGGVAIYPGDGETAASLLGNSTLAGNSGKDKRSHSIRFYSAEIQQTAEDREKFEQALRHAIREDVGLELHYQPVVDIATSRIVSLEALARWNSPEFGSVPPSRFIPVAEETGLIMPLGDWVLNTASRQIEAWRQIGLNEIRVAINVSFQQLSQPDFVERLCSIAHASQSQGRNLLAIELTETELMDNIEMTIQQIGLLKHRDFTIYIDDFGTGYSSLSHLQRLPVDILKIDQSFVGTLGESEGSEAIVRTIIALAQSLKLKTIAEGVETRVQLDMLKQLGCDYAQGYLFSKPKPVDEITRLLEGGGVLPPGA